MHIGVDYEKGFIMIPASLFATFEEEFTSFFTNFIFLSRNEQHVLIQLPDRLPNKKEVEMVYKGIHKTEKTCTFCLKRLRCTTNGWKCDGYKANPSVLTDFEKIESFLSKKSTILFVKADS